MPAAVAATPAAVAAAAAACPASSCAPPSVAHCAVLASIERSVSCTLGAGVIGAAGFSVGIKRCTRRRWLRRATSCRILRQAGRTGCSCGRTGGRCGCAVAGRGVTVVRGGVGFNAAVAGRAPVGRGRTGSNPAGSGAGSGRGTCEFAAARARLAVLPVVGGGIALAGVIGAGGVGMLRWGVAGFNQPDGATGSTCGRAGVCCCAASAAPAGRVSTASGANTGRSGAAPSN